MNGKTVENSWSMLMKFGSKENLEKLQAGQLYMKNLKYYVNLEKATSDEDVGDKYDGQVMLQDVKVSMVTVDADEFITQFDAPAASLELGYLKCPVLCMFMYDYRNHTKEEIIGDTLKVRYEFNEEQLRKMPNFGEYVLIVKNGNEFVDRIKKGLLAANVGYTRDFVQYYETNNLEHLRQVQCDNSRIAFWKRQKYSYQQEYRFLIHNFVDDFLCVEIGDISDITEIRKTEEVLNTYLEVSFEVKNPMDIINNELLFDLDKLHTTELGVGRIQKNLSLDTEDVVNWCKNAIENPNAYSYTIITAHRKNK